MEIRRGGKRQHVEEAAEAEPASNAACNYCHQSKVRCSGQVPCTRCAERCLPCRARELKRRGRKPAKGPSTEDQPALVPPLLARQPLLDMVLKQANPKGDAELFLRCFHKLYKEGRIVRERVLRDMRMWRTAALLCDADPTWGIAPALQRLLKISPVELEDPTTVGLELTPAAAKAKAQATMARLLEESRELEQSMTFRQFDDGVIPLHISCHSDSGGIVMAVNDAYKKLVMEAPEIFDQQIKRRSIHTLISASVVAPQDREMYLTKVLELRLTDVADASGIIKGFMNDGEVRLYYSRARRVEVDGKELIVYRMEPIPKSRYITDQPDIYHSIVKQYRHYGYTPGSSDLTRAPTPQPPQQQQQPSPPSSSGARAAGGVKSEGASGPPAATAPPGTASVGPPPFPALATFTINPPPSDDMNALCSSDPQRVMRIFPRVGMPPSGSPPLSAPPPSPTMLAPSMPLGVPAYLGGLPPRPTHALPLPHQSLPPPLPPPRPAHAAPPAMHMGNRAAAATPSPRGKIDADHVPILDEDMLSELLERFDE